MAELAEACRAEGRRGGAGGELLSSVLDVMALDSAKHHRLLTTVQLPAVVPALFSGLRLALAQSWLFLVAAELITIAFVRRAYMRVSLSASLVQVTLGGSLVALVKPQFEAGRQVVARGRGIVTEPEVWRSVLEEVTSACEARGATIMGVMASPITGTDGNQEFLAWITIPHAGIPEIPSSPVS